MWLVQSLRSKSEVKPRNSFLYCKSRVLSTMHKAKGILGVFLPMTLEVGCDWSVSVHTHTFLGLIVHIAYVKSYTV